MFIVFLPFEWLGLKLFSTTISLLLKAVQQQNHHLLRIELEGEFHDREQEFRETVGEKLVCLKKEKQEVMFCLVTGKL